MKRTEPFNYETEAEELRPAGSGWVPVLLAAAVGMAVSAALGWLLSSEHSGRLRRNLDEQVGAAVEN